ncbi:MAG: MBL fold metallo-hydrolase [Promethearchaeota archaeon]|nr:MAG: MBL fold metallo-hydrolase [Candidatus Lokiarchaeota archaeon]
MFTLKGSKKPGKEVIKNLFYFNENQMLDCNQYIIKNDENGNLTLFDAGNGISLKGLFQGMKDVNLDYTKINNIYLTHEHVDHVLGLYFLLDEIDGSEINIHAFGETAKILSQGDESKIFPGNLGISASMFGIEINPLEVNELKKSSKVAIGPEFKFEIYHVPGHSLGSIAYYEPEKKVLVPGDVVFTGGSFGRYDFPGGDLETLKNSIARINSLDVTYLLPGHMGISSRGNEQIQLSLRMINSIGSYF